MLDTLHLGRGKPMMHGLVELDVTLAHRRLRAQRERDGGSPSLTAFFLHALGGALAHHPEVHARRDWRGRLVLFDEVDVTTIVEVEHEGRSFPYAHVLRGIDRRGPRALHDELRSVRERGMRTTSPAKRRATRALLALPSVVRRASYRALLAAPELAQRHTGSALVSAVGMFGSGAGYGLSAPGLHDLSVIVGGTTTRASTDPNDTAPREVLCVTVSANHAIVDGGPLARFVGELARRVAAAEGLDDDIARASAQAPPRGGGDGRRGD